MAANTFFQEAVVSVSSHSSHILLQHRLGSVGKAACIIFNSPLDTPNNVPITFQSAPYLGVIYS